jgi:hypothetical protein
MDDADGFATLMHANLMEIFGQRDGTRRREAMRRAYAENIAFADPEGTVHGYDAVDERVREVLDKAPETFIFAPARPAGFEPATGCLEGRFRQGVNLRQSRSGADRDARG